MRLAVFLLHRIIWVWQFFCLTESFEIGSIYASRNHLRLAVFLLHRIIWVWQSFCLTEYFEISSFSAPRNHLSLAVFLLHGIIWDWQFFCCTASFKINSFSASRNHLRLAGPEGCLADTPQQQIQPAVSSESNYSRSILINHYCLWYWYLWTYFTIWLVSISPAGCSLRMASLGGWCYHVSQAQMPWHAARLACQALGGQLASITSSEEDLLVIELAREEEGALWTGGCQQSSRSGWNWEDGRRWRFTRWPSCEEHTRCTWGEPVERGCLVVSQSGWQV